jgi:hypothetical protein
VIMDYAAQEEADAAAHGTCVAPTVFKNQTDGYARWATYAQATGRGAAWKAWSEDETCPQHNIAADVEAPSEATAYCELDAGAGTCTDALEPDDSRNSAAHVHGTVTGLKICAADEDWLAVAGAGTVRIEFTHASGDLDMAAFDSAGNQTSVSQGTTDSEQVTVPAGGFVRIYGYNGAQNSYRAITP